MKKGAAMSGMMTNFAKELSLKTEKSRNKGASVPDRLQEAHVQAVAEGE